MVAMRPGIWPGVLLAGGVAATAARLGLLTADGAVAATAVGGLVFAAGGARWSAVLLLFFSTSSALSRLPPRRGGASEIAAKSGRRDSAQVLANGGAAAFYALCSLLHHASFWAIPFAGSLAAAAADTWATEIGAWSGVAPRLITTGRRVQAGTSGGVTPLGLAASVAGAVVIALATLVLLGQGASSALAVALGGAAGSLVDSLLGATIQEKRLCPTCEISTEQPFHRTCGSPTRVVGGWPGVNNDSVNGLACLTGSLIALVVSSL